MTGLELLMALEAEVATGYPGPPPESPEVKRERLLRLADVLRPQTKRSSASAALTWARGLRGRVCDLPPFWLDVVARSTEQTAEIRRANRQVNRAEAA